MPKPLPKLRYVLWVDDNPGNNLAGVAYLSAMQISVTKVLSTRQAMVQLKARQFDAIVSDMGRKEGAREGYVLLDEVRGLGLNTPYFFYAAGGSQPENVREAFERGASGSTSDMMALLDLVQGAIYNA